MIPQATIPYLLCLSNNRRFLLQDGQSWAVGRGEGCAVMLDSRSVSRLHALIQRKDAGNLAVVDLGSRNGSFLNGKRVSVPATLRDKDRIVFGDQELIFLNPTRPAGATPPQPPDMRDEPTTALHTNPLTTIVVVDIRDFTRLARTLPESILSQTIGTWFLRTGEIAQRRGSWAQKYIGDAVMAVWIHDKAADVADDLRNVLGALHEIATATSEISDSFALPGRLRIGAGVNTGLAIVGAVNSTALGDTVNVAFRLETATKALGMGVAVGERTYGELPVDARAAFVPREVELKGYDGSSRAWATSFEALQQVLKDGD